MSRESVHDPYARTVTVPSRPRLPDELDGGGELDGDRGEDIDDEPDDDLDDSLLRAVAAAPSIPLSTETLEVGTIVGGGFRVEGVLGAGAMGVVYEALDLTLDRKVALKLHVRDTDSAQTSRMWREAKAMARLSHPNVIAVHEVGEHEGRVFIAMELVEGKTVREWLKEPGPDAVRPWPEVLRVFIQAAQGLAAAHAEGLVHRDFKPDNILLGSDGRVRVADFGLARTASDEPELAVRPPVLLEHSPSIDERLTQTGAMVGTPAYMAPEQMSGGEVDHRCDQFGFCVALFEALYGVRPFDAPTLGELLSLTASGEVRALPSGVDVPGWLRVAVRRGLAPRPDDRFASMDELLVALRADPSRGRRRVALGIGVAAMLGLTAWVTRVASTEQPCRDMDAPIRSVWNGSAASQIEQAFSQTGSPLAADASARVAGVLDEYVTAWGEQRTEACRATRVRGEQSESMLDRRMTCLEQQRQQLSAVVAILSEPDAEVVTHAVDTVEGLDSLSVCADLEALQSVVPPPDDPATRDAVTEARAQIAAIKAAEQAGRAGSMQAEVDAVVQRAIELDYDPLLAEAYWARYLVVRARAEFEPAIADAVTAHRLATQVGDARTAWYAAVEVAEDVGRHRTGTEDALRWLEIGKGWSHRFDYGARQQARAGQAEANILHKGDQTQKALERIEEAIAQTQDEGLPLGVRATLTVSRASFLRILSRYDESRVYIMEGIEQLEAAYGREHPKIASALSVMVHVEMDQGNAEAALEVIERGLSIRRLIEGERSIGVVQALRERGDILTRLGRLDDALADYELALSILVTAAHRQPAEEIMVRNNIATTLGAKGDHRGAIAQTEQVLAAAIEVEGAQSVRVAKVRLNYASFLAQLGRHEESRVQNRTALEIFEKHEGPTHPHVGIIRLNIALSHMQQEQLDDARAELGRARDIFERHFEPTHFWLVRAARVEAEILEKDGRIDDALEKWERVVGQLEQALAPSSPEVVRARHGYGKLLMEAGRTEDAIEPLEEALRVGEQINIAEDDLGHTGYLLAQALWARPSSRARALEVAEAAVPRLRTDEPQMATEAEQWIAERRRRLSGTR